MSRQSGGDKRDFMQSVTIIHDTRERENGHILTALDSLGVNHEQRKLDFGDYSFLNCGRDFALTCVIERKANVDELYNNIMAESGRRLEQELDAGRLIANQFTLLIENCAGPDALRDYIVPDWQMRMTPARKVADIGRYCYERIRAWECGNRYQFRTRFVADPNQTAAAMLEEFYYYWHNYKRLVSGQKGRRK
jgi:hypothetical protein